MFQTHDDNHKELSSSSSSSSLSNMIPRSTVLPTKPALLDRRAVKFLFPSKLRRMLDDAEHENNEHIISWQPDGKSFNVHDRDAFTSKILGRYLCQKRFSSFTRQLYHYGFSKIDSGKNRGSFYHPNFRKDDIHACIMMDRKSSRGDNRTIDNVAVRLAGRNNHDVDCGLRGSTTTTTASAVMSSRRILMDDHQKRDYYPHSSHQLSSSCEMELSNNSSHCPLHHSFGKEDTNSTTATLKADQTNTTRGLPSDVRRGGRSTNEETGRSVREKEMEESSKPDDWLAIVEKVVWSDSSIGGDNPFSSLFEPRPLEEMQELPNNLVEILYHGQTIQETMRAPTNH